MGKINGCLKCVFIFFNVLFVILGCLLIYLAVRATAAAFQASAFGGPAVGWIWVIALGVFGISALGIFAACSENSLVLKIFAGFMVVGMIIMLIFGIVGAVVRSQVKYEFEQGSKAVAQPVMQDEDSRANLETVQTKVLCCGVVSAEDWGSTIPDSCECKSVSGPFGQAKCKAKPQSSSGPSQIYAQPCSDFIFSAIDIGFKVFMGFGFGFAITALMGLLFSIIMIRQVTRHDNPGGPTVAMKGY